MCGRVGLFAIVLAGLVPPSLIAGDIVRPVVDSLPASPAKVSAWIASLDSADYRTRQSSAVHIEKLLESTAGGPLMARLPRAAWEELSFDGRRRLSGLGVASASDEHAAHAPEEIGALVGRLNSERYLDRARALAALESTINLAGDPGAAYRALKRADADLSLSIDVRVTMARLLDTARYRWLTAGGYSNRSPARAELDQFIADLTAPLKSTELVKARQLVARNCAERELLDALAQSLSATGASAAIETALQRDDLDSDARNRLQRLAEWSRPGVAVEFWRQRRIASIQLFAIGVSGHAPGTLRPMQFDELTDDLVRCVSGNVLRPGEYPLGVAFPHPREQSAFFYIVALPGVRERLIYEYQTRTLDERERLAWITERTLEGAIEAKQPLDEAQMWLLGQLDQATVARFLRAYFAQVPDEPFDQSRLAPMLSDESSVHRSVCMMLAMDASPAVVPALVEAAENKRFIQMEIDRPDAMPWIAALAIAGREPWEGVDDWMGTLVARTERVSFAQGTRGSLGATAAAMLLMRHGERPEAFGLVARTRLERGLHDRFEAPINTDYRRRMFEDRLFKQLDVTPYAYGDADGASAVAAWWTARDKAGLR